MFAIAAAVATARQGVVTHAAPPFTVISQEGRRPLAAMLSADQVMVALDDVAALFQATVRDDAVAGGVTVTYKGKTVILTPGQPLASAAGRLVSLPSAPLRDGRRWLVPVEFISRALGLVYDSKLDVRKNARLVLVGDVRVPRITVRSEVLGPQTRVTFTVAPRTPFTVTQETGRIVVRFDADALDATVPPAAPLGLVQSVRLADPNNTFAIDVGPRFGSFRTSQVSQDEGAQLLVDLMPAANEPAQPPSASPRGGVAPLPVPPAPDTPFPLPSAGGLRTVVIDPGHGGDEPGAKGSTGALEKDISLAVARKLKGLIESRLGVRVLLTRDGDQTVALDERAALANNTKADLLVSLHANTSRRNEASGAQIYYLAPDQADDESHKLIAGRQTLPALGGGSREVEMVPWEFAQVRYVGESAALAGAIEEQLRGRARMNIRPILQAPLRLLAGANMPAVIVEMGFLSNPDEEQQLVSDAYQSTLAQAILEGMLRYRQAIGQVKPLPAPLPADPRRRP